MFRTNLDGRGGSKTEGDDGFINGTVSKLAFSPIGLKGAKLPVRPPVLAMGKGGEED